MGRQNSGPFCFYFESDIGQSVPLPGGAMLLSREIETQPCPIA